MLKQIIVMRKDLGMRKGKMIAQGAHASMMVLLVYLNDQRVKEWLRSSFTKICVYVDTEEELLELHNKSILSGVPYSIVKDNGKTEFGGKPTYTCCAIGPEESDKLEPITGHLPLL